MQLKRILATVMMAAVLVTSVTACGTGNGEVSSGASSAVSSEAGSAVVSLSDTAGSGYSSDNDTKVKQMLEKVTFNGEPLTIPYKASDLGEGFSFREDVSTYENDEGKEFSITILKCGSDSLCSVSLYGYNDSQSADEFIAYSIGYSILEDNKYNDLVQIDGVDGNSTMDDVMEKFGNPTTIENGSSSGSIYICYKIDDNIYISFWGTEDNHIMQMDVCNKPTE